MKTEKSKILRNLFKKSGVIQIVGAHDGLSAKIVEQNGFDGVWASGFEISFQDHIIVMMVNYRLNGS